jgi:hypothetical protein
VLEPTARRLARAQPQEALMSARYVIGMDCSTTATKAVVWDMEGNAAGGLHPGRARCKAAMTTRT